MIDEKVLLPHGEVWVCHTQDINTVSFLSLYSTLHLVGAVIMRKYILDCDIHFRYCCS
jgi:hypothetical protein